MNNKKFYKNIIEKIKIQNSSNKNLDQLNNSNYSAKFEKDGVVLFIFLDDSLKITKALYNYNKDDYINSLMEITCLIIKDLPIKEVREHGIMRIENYLNPSLLKKVEGVSLSTNYSPDFIWLNDLLIKICDSVIFRSKIKNKINFYSPRPTKKWLEKNEIEKQNIINKYIENLDSSTDITSKDVKITKIYNDNFFIEFLNEFNPADKSVYCMELEKIVRKDYDFLIVYMKRAQDDSPLRRKLELK